jgi:hypothetical protein
VVRNPFSPDQRPRTHSLLGKGLVTPRVPEKGALSQNSRGPRTSYRAGTPAGSRTLHGHLARLGLGSFASVMATRRRVHPSGLGFRRPVLLSLQSISGDCSVGGGSFGDVAVRYVYSYLEKSGWSLIPTCFGGLCSLRVYSSSGDSGSPANLEAAEPMSPDDVMATGHLLQPERSTIPVHIDNFDVLILMVTEEYEVSSLGWSSVSSCKLDVFPLQLRVRWELVGWLPRTPMMKSPIDTEQEQAGLQEDTGTTRGHPHTRTGAVLFIQNTDRSRETTYIITPTWP